MNKTSRACVKCGQPTRPAKNVDVSSIPAFAVLEKESSDDISESVEPAKAA